MTVITATQSLNVTARLGELFNQLPKATASNNISGKSKEDTQIPTVGKLGNDDSETESEDEKGNEEKPPQKPKLVVAAEMGFNKNQVAQFQKLADNPNAVQQAIDYAEKNNTIASRDDVKLWIVKNQFGRRDLTTYERSVIALKIKPVIAAKARDNLIAGAEMTNTGLQKSVKAVNTQQELAKAAGVSHDTIAKVEKIESQATPEIKAALKAGEISINEGYQAVKSGHTAREMNAIFRPCSTARKIPRNFLNVANQP